MISREEALGDVGGVRKLVETAFRDMPFSRQAEHPLEDQWLPLGGEPTKVHHLERDHKFLIELPQRIESHEILVDRQGLR